MFSSNIIGVISGFFMLASLVPYIIDIHKQKITPRPLSWIGWGLIIGISFFSQVYEYGFDFTMVVLLTSSVGCFLVSLYSIFKKNQRTEKFDIACFVLGIICVVIFLTTKSAWITTTFSILADFLVGIPTLNNAYRNPRNEQLISWALGTISTFLAFTLIFKTDLLIYRLYPTYLFIFNVTLFSLCLRRFYVK